MRDGKSFKAVEIRVVVFRDYLFYQTVFRLCHCTLRAFPDKQNKIFQEAGLFHVQFGTVDAERIHGYRLFFRIADVLAVQIFTKSFIGITGIYHHYIRTLLI